VQNLVLKVRISDSRSATSNSKSVNNELKIVVLDLDIDTFGTIICTSKTPILEYFLLYKGCFWPIFKGVYTGINPNLMKEGLRCQK
jgi:hypothetical protein